MLTWSRSGVSWSLRLIDGRRRVCPLVGFSCALLLAFGALAPLCDGSFGLIPLGGLPPGVGGLPSNIGDLPPGIGGLPPGIGGLPPPIGGLNSMLGPPGASIGGA